MTVVNIIPAKHKHVSMMTSPKWLLRAVSMLTTAKLWARSKKGLNRLSQPPNLTKRTCVNLKATTESEIHPELHDQVKIISVLGIIWTYSFGAKLSSSYANEQSLQRKSNSPPPPAPTATRRQRENYKHRQRVGGHWSAFKKGHHKGSNHQTFTFTFILMVHASPRNRSLFQTEMKLSWSSFRLTLLVQLHSQIPPFLSLSLVHSFQIQCLLYKSPFRIFLCYITNQNQHNGTVLSASERTRNTSALRDCLEQEFILQSIDSNLTVISLFSLDVRTHWFV